MFHMFQLSQTPKPNTFRLSQAQQPTGLRHLSGYPSVQSLSSQRHSQGFTLIELMVALVIFAMLAVVGWQVFDGLNRAKVGTKKHAQALSDLQYAYLQLQNDFTQVVVWGNASASTNNANIANNANGNSLGQQIKPEQTGFYLSPQGVSFVRFADPDPRYQNTPTLIRVAYVVADGKLVRQQFYDLNAASVKGSNSGLSSNGLSSNGLSDALTEANGSGLNTVLLSGIENSRWQPLDGSDAKLDAQPASQTKQNTASQLANPNSPLSKGLSVEFEIDGQPILWQFALPNAVDATLSRHTFAAKNALDKSQNGVNNNSGVNGNGNSNPNSNSGNSQKNGTSQPNSSQ